MKTLICFLFCLASGIISAQNKALYIKNTALFYAPIPTYSTKNLTMEVWVKPEKEDEHSFPLFLGSFIKGYGFHLHNGVNDNVGRFASIEIKNGSYSITGNPIQLPLKKWTHLALTHDSTGWKFYRNGEYVGNGEVNTSLDSLCKLQTAYFTGTIDEVRFWNITRTQKEIKESFQKVLSGNEYGLLSYYNFNDFEVKFSSTIINNTPDTSKNAILYGEYYNAGIVDGAPLIDEVYPQVEFSEIPTHYQFFPRDKKNLAPINITGTLKSQGWDSIICEITQNDSITERIIQPLNYKANSVKFEFHSYIKAIPVLFTYRIYVSNQNSRFLVGEAADLSCGDVFMIAGQSNSHPAEDSSTYVNPLLKTWGIQTFRGNLTAYNNADSSWGMANGHGFNYFFNDFTGPYLTGVWGIEIQRLLLEKYKIPTCIINVGGGSSSVYTNQRDDTLPLNLATIYGRGLFRARNAKVDSAIKAIFWLQGEGDSANGYAELFDKLYKDWNKDYPNATKKYVFQLRPGCPGTPHQELREFQRNLPKQYPDIKVIATVGLNGYDGCHYHHYGYIDLAEKAFWQLERDFYGCTDTLNINPPNIERAYFSTQDHQEITILFNQKKDEYHYPDKIYYEFEKRSLDDYFYLDGISGEVINGKFNRDTLVLSLRSSSNAKSISFLPDTYYNGRDSVIYEGPWIVNKKGVGALSFYNVPIEDNINSTVLETKDDIKVQYNDVEDAITIYTNQYIVDDIKLELYNVLGQLNTTQIIHTLEAGIHSYPAPQSNCNHFVILIVRTNNQKYILPIVR